MKIGSRKKSQNVFYLVFFIYLFLINANSVVAQQIKSDKQTKSTKLEKLLHDLDSLETGEEITKTLYLLGVHFYKKDSKKTNKYLDRALDMSIEIDDYYQAANCYNVYGVIEKNKGNHDLAITNYEKALSSLNNIANLTPTHLVIKGKVYINIANLLKYKSNYTKAVLLYLDAIRIFESIDKSPNIEDCYNNIGNLYLEQEDYAKALEYQNKVLQISEDDAKIARSISNISEIYIELEKFDIAFNDQQRALKLREKIGRGIDIMDSYEIMGSILTHLSDYELAESYLLKAVGLRKKLGIVHDESNVYCKLGELYFKTNNILKSIDNFEICKQTAIDKNRFLFAKQATQSLSEIHKRQRKYKLAYEYQQLYIQYKDSVNSREVLKDIKELHAIYETEKRDGEIKALTQTKAVQNKWVIGLLVVALLFVGLFLFAMWSNRLKKKANRLLKAEKEQSQKLFVNLQQTQEQLVQSEKMASLGQLTAGIAHEINNPINYVANNVLALKLDLEDIRGLLNAINGLSSNFNKDQLVDLLKVRDNIDLPYLQQEMQELIKSIEKGTDRTSEIVMSLRYFTREGQGIFEQTNIHEGIDSTLDVLQSEYTNHAVISKKYGDIPTILTLSGKLNQVILNIINNSIHAIKAANINEHQIRGKIEIETSTNDQHLIIKIKDNGIGMDRFTLSRIYDPFFTTKEIGEGTGLGMSISYGIIQQHNGKIEVESTVSKGTTFTIYLPFKQ